MTRAPSCKTATTCQDRIRPVAKQNCAGRVIVASACARDIATFSPTERTNAVFADSIWTMAGSTLLGLLANWALFVGSLWIARYGLRQPRGPGAVLAAVVVFWTVCTLGFEGLGIRGALSLRMMTALAIAVLGVGAVLRWFRAAEDVPPMSSCGNEPLSGAALASLALVVSGALLPGMRSLLLGVKVVSDGPIYHLYFAARWWKAERLFLVASPFGENAATYFPANGDLWFTWLMVTWGGDQLAKVGQVPFLFVACAAAYACAREVGAGRSASVIATTWFAASSPLLLFSFEPNVDTIFVAGYLVAAYFFLRAWRGAGAAAIADDLLGGLAAGLALGTKAVGVVFIPPLIGVALLAVWRRPLAQRTKAARTLVILAAPFLSGGFWFARNALLTGNPLYPLEIQVLGRSLFPGWYLSGAMRTSQYFIPFDEWRACGDLVLGVLDPRLAPFWIIALLAGCISPKARSAGTRSSIASFAVLAVLNVVLYWVCIPYRTQQRFMLQALGLAAVPLAMTLDRSPWLCRGAAMLLAVHLFTAPAWPLRSDGPIPWDLTPMIPAASTGTISIDQRVVAAFYADPRSRSVFPLIVLVGVLVSAMFMVWMWDRLRVEPRGRRRSGRVGVALAVTVLFFFLGGVDAWPGRVDSRLAFYPVFTDFIRGWLTLEARSGPAGVRVAYSGTNIPYYLFGQGLRNDVRYVNIDRHRDWLMHDYHRQAAAAGKGLWPNSRPGWDRVQPDYQAWVDNLDAAGIQLLVVTRVNPDEGPHNVADAEHFPIERQWADAHPERFEAIYGSRENDPWFRLYRFRRSDRRGER